MDNYGWDETDNLHYIWMPGVNPPVWTSDKVDYQGHITGVPSMESQRRGYQRVGEGFDNLTWPQNYPELEASGLVSGIPHWGPGLNHQTLMLNSHGNIICLMEDRQILEQGDRKLGRKRIRGITM